MNPYLISGLITYAATFTGLLIRGITETIIIHKAKH